MFPPKDAKAKFRLGAKVTCDGYSAEMFKVVRKDWDADGSLRYTIKNSSATHLNVKQKDLNKLVTE